MAKWEQLDLKRLIIFDPYIKKHVIRVADIQFAY